MNEQIRDSISRVRMSFEPKGENLIVQCWVEPGGRLPAHLHPRQEERWSVLEGAVRFRLGEEERVIGPADGEIVVQPGTVHGVTSASPSDARAGCEARAGPRAFSSAIATTRCSCRPRRSCRGR